MSPQINENHEEVKKSDLPFDLDKVMEKWRNVKTLKDLNGPDGMLQEMFKGLIEKILKAEQEIHLGYEPYQKADPNQKNSRNGFSKKTVKSESGEFDLQIQERPRGDIRTSIHQETSTLRS